MTVTESPGHPSLTYLYAYMAMTTCHHSNNEIGHIRICIDKMAPQTRNRSSRFQHNRSSQRPHTSNSSIRQKRKVAAVEVSRSTWLKTASKPIVSYLEEHPQRERETHSKWDWWWCKFRSSQPASQPDRSAGTVGVVQIPDVAHVGEARPRKSAQVGRSFPDNLEVSLPVVELVHRPQVAEAVRRRVRMATLVRQCLLGRCHQCRT